MTLAEFLLARIAEDEREAWSIHSSSCAELVETDWGNRPCDCGLPARVVVECEAKRQIINLHPEAVAAPLRDGAAWSHGEVLRRLALPYAIHPDYQQEWAV